MDVALSYNRSRVEADTTASSVTAAGRRAHVATADLAKPEECRALVDGAAEAFGRLDVLINMASVYSAVPFDATDEKAWDRVVDVDLKAAFSVPTRRCRISVRLAADESSTSRTGSPSVDDRGTPAILPYYVAKRAVIGLTEALALELAADQILVNAVAPGPIVAPPGTSPEELADVAAVPRPLGRWGGEAEITKAVAFLLESDFVTGETIRVDGGRHVK